jgi:hypothetical protein
LIIHGKDLKENIWTDRGLSNDAAYILVFNIFTPPISNYLNPFYLLRIWKRKSIAANNKDCLLTQKEANAWFAGTEFDIAQSYAN